MRDDIIVAASMLRIRMPSLSSLGPGFGIRDRVRRFDVRFSHGHLPCLEARGAHPSDWRYLRDN